MDKPTTESTQTETNVSIHTVCPHCGKSFWHKIGHFFKSVGTEAIETAVDVALPPGAMGRD
jgi:hypothetical protein